MRARAAGVNMRVNAKVRGDCFGEVSLMYSCPRSATVAATQDAVVWVLERDVFRRARRLSLLLCVLRKLCVEGRHGCLVRP